MTQQFDEFLEEIERDIRQEKLLKIWQQHGRTIIIAIVGVLALVGAYTLWQNYEAGTRLRQSQKLIGAEELILSGKTEQAREVLQGLAAEGRGFYKVQAQLLLAGLVDGGTGYEALAKDTSLDPLVRDFALFMSVSHQLKEGTPPDTVLSDLEPLLKPENPWYFPAKELQGFILHLKGDQAQAIDVFSSIARNAQTPKGVMMRAQIMTQILMQSAS